MWSTGLELMALLEGQNIAINGVGNDIFILWGLFNLLPTNSQYEKSKKNQARFQIQV